MSEIDTTIPVSEVSVDNETMELKTSNGLPAGGTTDQILAKASDADYDTKWVDAPSGGEKLYYHFVNSTTTGWDMTFCLITKSSEVITKSSLKTVFPKAEYPQGLGVIPIIGKYRYSSTSPNTFYEVTGVYYSVAGDNVFYNKIERSFNITEDNTISITETKSSSSVFAPDSATLTDTVIEII